MTIHKFALLNLIALTAAVVFWPYATAGLFASALCGMRFHRRVSSGIALALVSVLGIMNGDWIVRIGESAPEHWYFEMLPGTVSWVLAAILVSAFSQWPEKILEGYRSRLNMKRGSTVKFRNRGCPPPLAPLFSLHSPKLNLYPAINPGGQVRKLIGS
jgi:hypothetical protein